MDPLWCRRTSALAAKRKSNPILVLVAPPRDFLQFHLAPPHILNSLFMLASVCGLWAGAVYVPTAVTTLAEASGRVGPQAAHLVSYATMLVAFATILGCLAMPTLAERFGRRATLAMFFALMFVFILLTFGKVFYLTSNALPWFFLCLFFLGLGGANFAVYTL
jgi:MFS family permease